MQDLQRMHSHHDARRGLRALVVDDEATIRGPLGLCLETLGHVVVEAANVEEAIAAAGAGPLDVAMVDVRLGTANGLDLMTRLLAMQPRLKIIIITAYASVDVAVGAMTRGAMDFLCKPFTPEQVAALVRRAGELLALEATVGSAPDFRGTAGPEADFATTSAALEEAVSTARRVAPSDAAALIVGERGTGKGVLARAIHGWSRRAGGAFVSIDCAARSPGYVDLALFGDTAVDQRLVTAESETLVEAAAGGTLLLRHVEALSARSQERVVRLLETKELEAKGKRRAKVVDVRVLATTCDVGAVEGAALGGALGSIRVMLPPLRERVGEIPLLAQRYLGAVREATGNGVLGISADAMEALKGYGWPGNLAELRGAVEAAAEVAGAAQAELRHFPAAVREAATGPQIPRAGDPVSLRAMEVAHIREVIARSSSLQAAADTLGLDLQALYRRRKQFGLE